MTNSLDPDHARHSFGSDLGSNSLQSLSAYDKEFLVIRQAISLSETFVLFC